MKRQGFIYKITSPTDKIYIGQTIDINLRKTMHKSVAKKSKCKLYASINKYGWDSHGFDILEDGLFSKPELDELEIGYIQKYDSFVHGLNMTRGGDGAWGLSHSEDFKQRHRERMTGTKNPFHNRKHTSETIEVLRIKATGKTLSAESREKVSKASKGNQYALGYKHTPEALAKMLEGAKRNKGRLGQKQSMEEIEKRAKKAWKSIKSEILSKEWPSIKSFCEEMNVPTSSATLMLKGKLNNKKYQLAYV